MEEELYYAIERYLANDMTPEERATFETRITQDEELAEKLTIYRSASQTLSSRLRNEEKEKLFRKTLSEIEIATPANGNVRALRFYGWAAAASIALLCVALFYTSKLTKPDFAEYYTYEPLALVERGNEDSARLQAQEDFNAKEYEKAIADFDVLLLEDKDNTELLLYKGIAFLELDNITEANKLFNTVRASGSIYKDKATWMLALVALKQKDYEGCEALLKEIPTDSPEYRNAEKLLEDL